MGLNLREGKGMAREDEIVMGDTRCAATLNLYEPLLQEYCPQVGNVIFFFEWKKLMKNEKQCV